MMSVPSEEAPLETKLFPETGSIRFRSMPALAGELTSLVIVDAIISPG